MSSGDQEKGYAGHQDDPIPNEERTVAGQFELHLYELAPDRGSTDGGDLVTLTGNALSGVTSVRFGDTDATEFTVDGDSVVKAVAPAGTGTVSVSVATEDAQTDLSDAYTYIDKS